MQNINKAEIVFKKMAKDHAKHGKGKYDEKMTYEEKMEYEEKMKNSKKYKKKK